MTERERLFAWQDRLAHSIMPWSVKDRDVFVLYRQGFWIAASGWGLHIEGMS